LMFYGHAIDLLARHRPLAVLWRLGNEISRVGRVGVTASAFPPFTSPRGPAREGARMHLHANAVRWLRVDCRREERARASLGVRERELHHASDPVSRASALSSLELASCGG
ncbi:MAG: hypothetical protein SGPRY_006318, partial [Prymnesium sp.]